MVKCLTDAWRMPFGRKGKEWNGNRGRLRLWFKYE